MIEGFTRPGIAFILRCAARSLGEGSADETKFRGSQMHDHCGDRPLLGAVLVAQGAVDGGALDQALRAQAQTGERLGEFLVRLGLI